MERLYLGLDIEVVLVVVVFDDDVIDVNGFVVGFLLIIMKCRIFFRDIKKRCFF